MASSSTADAGATGSMDERRKKVLTDYRKRLLESRELEGKVKERGLFERTTASAFVAHLPVRVSIQSPSGSPRA